MTIDMDWNLRVRFWLIRLLAGRAVVILNATIFFRPQEWRDKFVRLENINGGLIVGNEWEVPFNMEMVVSQSQRRKVDQMLAQFRSAKAEK